MSFGPTPSDPEQAWAAEQERAAQAEADLRANHADYAPDEKGTPKQEAPETARWLVAEMTSQHPPHRNFLNNNHALDTGYLLGYLRRQEVDAEPDIDSNGDYTARLRINIAEDGRDFVEILVLPQEPG